MEQNYQNRNTLAHTKWNCKYHKEDMMYDQISLKEYKDPFNG